MPDSKISVCINLPHQAIRNELGEVKIRAQLVEREVVSRSHFDECEVHLRQVGSQYSFYEKDIEISLVGFNLDLFLSLRLLAMPHLLNL